MADEELRQAVRQIVWFHTMELGPGVVTNGYDDTPRRARRIPLPETLAGKSVLDIGCWDGFFSFAAERLGASDVLATDSFAWNAPGWSGRRGFDLAGRALGSRVRSLEVDVMDLSPERIGKRFDVVLCLGVLYHLRHPLLALERIASVTEDLLILETVVDSLCLPWPSLAFYPDRELNGDPTNWFAPNIPACLGLLRAAGFGSAEVVSRSSVPRRLLRAIKRRVTCQEPLLRGAFRDRITVYAHKGQGS